MNVMVMMLATEIVYKLEYLETVVSAFAKLVSGIDREFPHPELIERGDRCVFRHRSQEQSDTLASYLKLVRIISLLNACLHLTHEGHVQEVYILCRAIDEAEDDITFFALPLEEEGADKDQMRLLKEFYQEEHENPHDPLSNSKRDRVSRKKIRAASAKILADVVSPNIFLRNVSSIYQTFSGYVHGTYVAIMEMYHPSRKSYQMCGMPNSSRALECIDNLPNHMYRAISSLETLSYRIKRMDIAKAALLLNCDLAETTGCLDKEGINNMKRRLESGVLKDVS